MMTTEAVFLIMMGLTVMGFGIGATLLALNDYVRLERWTPPVARRVRLRE